MSIFLTPFSEAEAIVQDPVQKDCGDLKALAAAGVDVTLTPRETMLALGIASPSTLWRWVRAGKVPPPFKLAEGSDRNGFSALEIAELQAKRKQERVWTEEPVGKLGRPKTDAASDSPSQAITP